VVEMDFWNQTDVVDQQKNLGNVLDILKENSNVSSRIHFYKYCCWERELPRLTTLETASLK
jgi:hypothetical protein